MSRCNIDGEASRPFRSRGSNAVVCRTLPPSGRGAIQSTDIVLFPAYAYGGVSRKQTLDAELDSHHGEQSFCVSGLSSRVQYLVRFRSVRHGSCHLGCIWCGASQGLLWGRLWTTSLFVWCIPVLFIAGRDHFRAGRMLENVEQKNYCWSLLGWTVCMLDRNLAVIRNRYSGGTLEPRSR